MKTAIVTPCFLEGLDPSGSFRLSRNIRYIEYYTRLKDNLRFDDIWLLDNASSYDSIQRLHNEVKTPFNLFRFPERLTHTGGPYGYPYCWRALGFIENLMNIGYDRIFLIDSDCFVVSQKLVNFMNECNSGWQTLWCKKWNFPEASFQIITRDVFHHFKEFMGEDPMQHVDKCMETVLPFTHINKEFNADRFGEDRIPQGPGMDLYSQCPTNIQMTFEL